ncbi:hypothetical protein I308_106404 [Cryptococcus tetragattii IND107]|uniref:Cytochrome c oxidase assembly factor 3 n=1 Tax=Cryptococcus tetragattii IND107 TaxID=1296105 RepID=A0ABR3BIT1_9TREE
MSSPTPPPPQQASRPVPSYKAYTGPDPSTIAVQRSKAEAERYWARMSRKADESVLPVRVNKALGFGGWIAGTIACAYMVLFADFGPREHVFSPVRREYQKLKQSFFTLSPEEQRIVGLQQEPSVEDESQRRPS